jgi:trimeric autotransporter adhesin
LTSGTVTLTNCTVSGNTGTAGGSVYIEGGTATLTNTIVAGNTGGDVNGGVAPTITNCLIGSNPLLTPLGDYGGPTQNMALLPGSPAINAGTSGAGIPTTDQRGKSRVGATDIGAFESQGYTVTATAGTPQSTLVNTAFANPLKAKLTENGFNSPLSGATLSFAGPASGASITTNPTATTDSNGIASVSVSANGTTGSYTVTATATGVASAASFSLANVNPLVKLVVTPANPSVAKGLARQFTATGTYTDNSTQNLTSQVTWASGSASVATITAAGLATGVATGASSISATLSGVTGSTVLTVTAAALQSIAVTPANPSVAQGLTRQFTATGTYSDNSTQNLTPQVTWASGSTSVATITALGLARGVATGASTISATLSGVTGSTVLTVTAAALQSIAVTPANPSVAKGLTRQFTATGTYSDQSTQNLTSQVKWASATTAVATINTGGLTTGVATGTSSISATLSGVTGSTVLTVTAAALQSIAVTPANPSVAKGLTRQFTATGTYSDQSTQNLTSQVTWASATTAVATINTGGLATGVATGTSSISATLSGVTGSTVLTVTAAALQSIAVTPANPSVAKGLTRQFTATGTYSDQSTQNLTSQVTWASAATSVATINTAGLATGVATGASTISATLSGVTGSTVLTVTAAALQSITVTPANPTVAKGLTRQFTATGTFTDSSTQNLTSQVTWASAATSVATINTAGLATGVATGASTISATLSGVTGSTVLTVTAANLQSIAVTPANPSVAKGLTTQFTATGTFSDNSTQNLTSQVTWASAATSVATITAAGLATGVAAGASTISATLSGVTGSTVLTVTAAALQSIAVTPANPSVAKGLTAQFTATGTYSDQSTQNLTSQVTWASAATSVATITAAGLATGVATGSSTISATLSGVTGSTVLTVTAAALQSIAVTPANPSVAKGLTAQFTATGTFTDNSTSDLTTQVTWASGTASVATINTAGLATGVSAGTTTISAALSGVTGSTLLTVTGQAAVSSASVSWGVTGNSGALVTQADGLRLLPSGRTIDMPWLGVDRVAITLDMAASLVPGDVSIMGVNGGNYGPVTISGSGASYVISFAKPITDADRVTVTIANAGIATFTRRLDVLPGDVSDDGVVNSQDAVIERNQVYGVAPATLPLIFLDINGDGVVDATDYDLVRQRNGKRLP